MQAFRSNMTLVILGFFAILGLLAWVSKSPWLVVFAAVILLASVVGLQKADEDTQTLSERKVMKRVRDTQRKFMKKLPTPFMLVARSGRVVFANDALVALYPRYSEGAHYSSIIRSPIFLQNMAKALGDEKVKRFRFQSTSNQDQVYEVSINALDKDMARLEKAAILVELADRTEDARIETMRRDFIANASHELRTPLTTVLGFIETLEDNPGDKSVVKKFLPTMKKESLRMERLIDDLMSLSQIERRKHIVPVDKVDLARLIHEAAQVVDLDGKSNGFHYNVELPAEGIIVKGDSDELTQVVMNLLNNARKYGKTDGNVTVRTAEANAAHPNMIGVEFADNGIGIMREDIPRLTERFYRVSPKRSKDRGGTGLGLAIVKHILLRHRGALQIESEYGVGSTFTIWFPENN